MSTAPRALSALIAVAVAVGLTVAAYGGGNVAVLFVVTLLQAAGVELSLPLLFITSVVVLQLVFFVGVSVLYLRYRGITLSEIGVRIPTLEEWIAAGAGFIGLIVLWLGASITSFFLANRFGIEQPQQDIIELGQQDPTIFILLGVLSLLIVGPAEELLFRGVIQTRLRETFGVVVALTLATAVFALIHLPGFLGGGIDAALLGVSTLFVVGAVLAVVYEYTGNLVIVALLHGLFNAIQASLGYFSVTFDDGEMAAACVELLSTTGVIF